MGSQHQSDLNERNSLHNTSAGSRPSSPQASAQPTSQVFSPPSNKISTNVSWSFKDAPRPQTPSSHRSPSSPSRRTSGWTGTTATSERRPQDDEADFREQLAAKEEQLAAKEEQVNFKEEQLAAKDQQLATKDQQLATKDEQLAAKDVLITANNEQLAAKDIRLAAKDAMITERDDSITAKDKLITSLSIALIRSKEHSDAPGEEFRHYFRRLGVSDGTISSLHQHYHFYDGLLGVDNPTRALNTAVDVLYLILGIVPLVAAALYTELTKKAKKCARPRETSLSYATFATYFALGCTYILSRLVPRCWFRDARRYLSCLFLATLYLGILGGASLTIPLAIDCRNV